MRIGIDCRMYSTNFTGIGKYNQQLIENLAKIDQTNKYFLFFNEPEFSQFKVPTPNFSKFLVNAPHYSLKEQTKFLLAIHQIKPDLMHFTHFNAPLAYLGKQIFTIHDLTLHFYPGHKYINIFQRLAYKAIFTTNILKAKKIITPTKHTANDLNLIYPFTKKKTHTIYEGLSSTFKNFSILNYKTPPLKLPKKYILYTGNWRGHKNIDTLLSAFEILTHQYNYSGKLILTGKASSAEPKLQKRVEELVKKGLVITLGLISEEHLPYLYYNAECYVFPSFYEGFGLPVLEAFATNTPIVVSNSSCLEEVGAKGVLSFNPLDAQDMALKINTVLTDTNIRSQLIEYGSKRLQDFSFKKMAEETLKLYNSI